MRVLVLAVAVVLSALSALPTLPAGAQIWADGAPDAPRFEQCLPPEMAAFEAALQGPAYGMDWRLDAINVHWVQHCGYLAMAICEVSTRPLACQRRLRAALAARGAELRAILPDAESVGDGPLAPLYAQVRALAFGSNAGDECAGEDLRQRLWCQSFEAALGYEAAVWAWQVARLMGVMGLLDWAALSVVE